MPRALAARRACIYIPCVICAWFLEMATVDPGWVNCAYVYCVMRLMGLTHAWAVSHVEDTYVFVHGFHDLQGWSPIHFVIGLAVAGAAVAAVGHSLIRHDRAIAMAPGWRVGLAGAAWLAATPLADHVADFYRGGLVASPWVAATWWVLWAGLSVGMLRLLFTPRLRATPGPKDEGHSTGGDPG